MRIPSIHVVFTLKAAGNYTAGEEIGVKIVPAYSRKAFGKDE